MAEGQVQSLQGFVEATRSGVAVVAGDLNAEEGELQIRDLARSWVDAYRTVHPDLDGLTCCADDLTAGPDEPLEMRIDYIFLVPAGGHAWRVLNAERAFYHPFRVASGWQWSSDHLGLMAEVEW